MDPDGLLLRRYAQENNHKAFDALVHRHLGLVYNAALRRLGGDPHRAAEVSQQVFIALARNAGNLEKHPALGAWLHTATRNAAANLVTAERRRRAREAVSVSDPVVASHEAEPSWAALRPLLDQAIDRLADKDKVVVVLRFLEGLSFVQIGARLGLSEDAARMRTERALDRLRGILAQHGVRSTASALGSAVLAYGSLPPPASLASNLSAVSIGVAETAAVTFTMTTKILAASVAGACLSFGAGYYTHAHRPDSSPQVDSTSIVQNQDFARLQAENQKLQAEVARLSENVGALTATRARLSEAEAAPKARPEEEIRQALTHNLRQLASAYDQYTLEKGTAPASLADLVGEGRLVKRLVSVAGEDYSLLAMIPGAVWTVTTPGGVSASHSLPAPRMTAPANPPPRQEATRMMELSRKTRAPRALALEAFRAAHGGRNPSSERDLVPYFATVEEGADFMELLELRSQNQR